jgi:hypothetical protein
MSAPALTATFVAKLEGLMSIVVRAATSLAVAAVVAACSGASPATSPSSPAAAASLEASPSPVASVVASVPPASPPATVAPSASSAPTIFTSTTYGYSLTLPAGWTSIQATAKWDGKGAPFHDVPEADQFVGPAAASAWFFGAPTTKDLAARVKESITANAASHGNTCPAVPEVQDPITIGGEKGTLLGYNCGILINSGITVHKGIAYLFGFRDPAVHAATDPVDRAIFVELLKSVQFPS